MPFGGGFNTRAFEWSVPHPDSRRKCIFEMAMKRVLVVFNMGSSPTFGRLGCEGSIPNVSFAPASLVSLVE